MIIPVPFISAHHIRAFLSRAPFPYKLFYYTNSACTLLTLLLCVIIIVSLFMVAGPPLSAKVFLLSGGLGISLCGVCLNKGMIHRFVE